MQIDPFLFLLILELLLVTTVVAITVVAVTLSRKRKDKQAALTLVGRIKEDLPRRKDETTGVLVSRYGLDEGSAKELSTQIDRGERYFYQTMVNTYLKRDRQVLENLNVEFESSVEPYRNLTLKGLARVVEEAPEPAPEAPSAAVAGDGGGDSAECERLKIENSRLSQELRITMETMGRMLNEYSNMFGGGSDFDHDGQKQLIDMFEEMRDALQESGDLSIGEGDAEPLPTSEPQPEADEAPEATEIGGDEEEITDAMFEEALSEEPSTDSDDDGLFPEEDGAELNPLGDETLAGLEEDLDLGEPEPESDPDAEPEPKPE
jgi:hypothetical protein